MVVRYFVVVGSFYFVDEELVFMLERFFSDFGEEGNDRRIIVGVVFYVGYIFFGYMVSRIYKVIFEDGFLEMFVIFGLNYIGFGFLIVVYFLGIWIMLFGEIEVDGEFVREIVKILGIVDFDDFVYKYEYFIEV